MKINLLPMLTAPEPSPAPAGCLLLAILISACITAATGALLWSLPT